MFVAAVEPLRKNERQGETQEPSIYPPLNANLLLCRYFFDPYTVYDQTQGTGAVFS